MKTTLSLALALLVLGVGIFGCAKVNDTSVNLWTQYTYQDGLAGGYVTDIAIDSSNNVWVASRGYPGGSARGGVSKFNGSKWAKCSSEEGFPTDYVWSIAIDKDGTVWVGTDNGALKFTDFDNKKWEWVGPSGKDVWAITIDDAGNKWFGTSDGLYKYNGSSWATYTTTDGLINNYVNCIVFDNSNDIWLGTDGGVSKFNGISNWTNYTTNEGLASNYVKVIVIDKSSNKWFGCSTYDDKKISKLSGNTWSLYGSAEGFADNPWAYWVYSGIIDKNGNVWFGTDKGAYKFDGTKYINYKLVEQEYASYADLIWGMAIDNNGYKWFGTGGEGVWRYTGD
jgi:ligand-binding sensor domain-containing protein